MQNIEHLKYEYEFDLSSDCAAAKIVHFTGTNKNILEIGAGPGSISRVLKEINGCCVTALEINPDVVKKLNEFCNRVISADLNDPNWPTLFNEKFDVVIAADVLEHLYDPLSTLQKMKELITEDGYICLSLPHVGHAAIFACLWDEDFEYRQTGLLDFSHIRFFGLKNIQSLVQNAGLTIADAHFVLARPEDTEFSERWNKMSNSFKNFFQKNPHSFVYQVVIKAVKSNPKFPNLDLMRIHKKTPQWSFLRHSKIGFYLKRFLTSSQKEKLKKIGKKLKSIKN